MKFHNNNDNDYQNNNNDNDSSDDDNNDDGDDDDDDDDEEEEEEEKEEEDNNNTVGCRYNTVDFFQNPHNWREGELWGVCCDSDIWFTFCHCYRSVMCDIMIN